VQRLTRFAAIGLSTKSIEKPQVTQRL